LILPAGSRLRFAGRDFEMWGYGYLAAVYLNMEVVSGDLTGLIVALSDAARWLVTGAVGRDAMAAVFLAADEAAPLDLAAEVAARRASVRAIVEAGQSLPSR
jgi:hypothetical protein